MESLDAIREAARKSDLAAFRLAHDRGLLLKPPERRSLPQAVEAALGFRTTHIGAAKSLPSVDPHPREWRAIDVAKKLGNPFPDRVSVGRAPNCDIVLRVAYVSKLQAHFVSQDDGTVVLVDAGSSNGTYVDGEELPQGVPRLLRSGADVRFGVLGFFYLRAEDAWDALRKDEFRM
jgi:hypothetical protein